MTDMKSQHGICEPSAFDRHIFSSSLEQLLTFFVVPSKSIVAIVILDQSLPLRNRRECKAQSREVPTHKPTEIEMSPNCGERRYCTIVWPTETDLSSSSNCGWSLVDTPRLFY